MCDSMAFLKRSIFLYFLFSVFKFSPGNTTSLNFILIGDFRAKPADWKYQWWGCTSWPMFTCSVKLDLLFPMLEMHVFPQDMEKCVKVMEVILDTIT